MYDLMTEAEFNKRYNVGLNDTTTATKTTDTAAPMEKRSFCPVRTAQAMDARHKVVSILHMVIMLLLALLLFRLVFKA